MSVCGEMRGGCGWVGGGSVAGGGVARAARAHCVDVLPPRQVAKVRLGFVFGLGHALSERPDANKPHAGWQ